MRNGLIMGMSIGLNGIPILSDLIYRLTSKSLNTPYVHDIELALFVSMLLYFVQSSSKYNINKFVGIFYLPNNNKLRTFSITTVKMHIFIFLVTKIGISYLIVE